MYRLLVCSLFFISTLTFAQSKNATDQIVTIADKSFLQRDFKQPVEAYKQEDELSSLRQDIFKFNQVHEFILRALVEDYAKQNDIKPDAAHIDGFQKAYASAGMSDEKLQSLARFNALRFAADKAIYQQFGGRVVFDQAHPTMPIEAYAKLLMAYKKTGRLVFQEEKYEMTFWQSLERPDALVIPAEDVNFSAPWWMSVAR